MKSLDLEAIQAFVLVAELRSFTRAAEAMDSTQSAVSLKLKRLEDRLGKRLIERTPRRVSLSMEGLAFLDAAKDLLSSHERALGAFVAEQRRLVIGISHLIVGSSLPGLLTRLYEHDPGLTVELRVAGSRELLAAFDAGTLDAVIVIRTDEHRRHGEVLYRERFGWIAKPDWEHRQGAALALATQGEGCSVRASAVRMLDEAGIAWTEVFIGKGAAVVGAAAAAGLAVALMAYRSAPPGTVDIGPALSLPVLPSAEVALYTTVSDARGRSALKILAAAFKATSNP